MGLGPVEVVGAVGNAVARGELARGFEGLDELVLLGRLLLDRSVLVDAADFAGAGLALREQLRVCRVEVEQALGDELALGLVGLEDLAVGEAALDVVDLPRKVLGVEEGSVHTLASLGGMCVAAVASHENSLVESVTFRDTLTDRVD